MKKPLWDTELAKGQGALHPQCPQCLLGPAELSLLGVRWGLGQDKDPAKDTKMTTRTHAPGRGSAPSRKPPLGPAPAPLAPSRPAVSSAPSPCPEELETWRGSSVTDLPISLGPSLLNDLLCVSGHSRLECTPGLPDPSPLGPQACRPSLWGSPHLCAGLPGTRPRIDPTKPRPSKIIPSAHRPHHWPATLGDPLIPPAPPGSQTELVAVP